MVASCVLLESLERCREGLRQRGWPLDIVQIQAAEARPLGADAHLVALNPVFLLAAQKPGRDAA